MTLNEFLKTHKTDDNYKLGIQFGEYLHNYHNKQPCSNKDWYEIFNTKANYLFYMHGVSDFIGDDDYILIDYINDNKHLTKNLKACSILGKVNFQNIEISDDLEINITSQQWGDKTFDFVNVNQAALVRKEFAKGVFEEYFKNEKVPIKFFRLLSLYQAYIILTNIVNSRNNKTDLDDEETNGLLNMYDNFNQFIPKWIEED